MTPWWGVLDDIIAWNTGFRNVEVKTEGKNPSSRVDEAIVHKLV
jgi:hypothetical protein